MYLADEFYLIAHEDTTGQPRLHARAAGFGVAAALLAELYLQGSVTIDVGGVTAKRRQDEGARPAVDGASGGGEARPAQPSLRVVSAATPSDPLARTVLEHLFGEPQEHPVRDWLAFLGRTAVEDVARRLTSAGVLEMVQTRRLFGLNRTFVPVAINDAAWPHARVASRLARRQAMEPKDQILAGLAFATGLTREMLWDDEQQISQVYLAQIIAGLPVPIRTLVSETEIAISKTAATRG